MARIKAVDATGVWISFDGWNDDYDYYSTAPHFDLAPVGTAASLQLCLQPPKMYNGAFDWNAYLALINARAAPVEAFPTVGNREAFSAVQKLLVQRVAPAPSPAPAPAAAPAVVAAQAAPVSSSTTPSPAPVVSTAGATELQPHTPSSSDEFVDVGEEFGFEDQVNQLRDMGFFNRSEVLRVLREHNGSMENTINALIELHDLNWHRRR